ncbi:MAG: hypothetical protein QOE63_1 [Acidimicrobiaceae bacterium]
MGQPITVVEKRSSRPGIVRFEVNRPLSGMGHERWVAGQPIEGDRTVDELARRIFAHGGVDAVHINGSVVTVQLARGSDAAGLADVIAHLFRFYPDAAPGAAPTTAEAAPSTEPPEGEAEGHAESEAEPATDPAAVEAEAPAPTA